MPVVRFILVFLACVVILGLLARMMDDSDARWTTGAAVWGGGLALAGVDFVAQLRR